MVATAPYARLGLLAPTNRQGSAVRPEAAWSSKTCLATISPRVYRAAMNLRKTSLERAFDLAESGKCSDLSSLRASLKREGYSDFQITGGQLLGQLRSKIKAAKESGRARGE